MSGAKRVKSKKKNMNKSDLSVGQKVYLQPIGNNSRYSTKIEEGVISSVGNKYFTIEGFRRDKFSIETMYQHIDNFMPGWKVWISLEDYENYKLLGDYSSKLGRMGSGEFAQLGLEKLKVIMDLISK